MSKTKSSELQVVSPGGTSSESPTITLKERRDRVVNYHTGCKGAAKQQVIYALMAGMELIQAKAAVPRGKWMDWVAELPDDLPHRTATQYMRFAETLQPKLATVANFDFAQLRLINGDLPEDQKEIVLEAVKETTCGNSLTDLYRELGIVKAPTARAATPGKRDLSPAEAAAAEKKAAEDYGLMILADLAKVDPKMRALWSDDLRAQLSDAFIDQGNALRELKKAPAPQKGKKK